MSQLVPPPDDLDERIELAFGCTAFDAELLDKLCEYGYDKNSLITMVNDLRERFINEEITCSTVRNDIRNYFPKRNPRARRLAIQYRQAMLNWVNGASPFPYPPTLPIQRLPELTPHSLARYLNLLERYHKKDQEYSPPSTDSDSGEMENEGDYLEMIRCEMGRNAPETLKEGEIYQPIENLKTRIKEFINQDEDNALQVLVHIMELTNSNQIQIYKDLMSESLRRLSGNIVFIRSLFNSIDRSENSNDPKYRISGEMIAHIYDSLIDVGIISRSTGEDRTISTIEPRDFQFHNHIYTHTHTNTSTNERTQQRTVFEMKIPSDFLPVHWNCTRLVNPTLNPTFQNFAKILEKDAASEMNERIEESATYINEIKNNRRYGLKFSRMPVTDIPGTEDMDIWFHFSKDDDMEANEIKVGIVVNDTEIVYFLQDGVLGMRSGGNMIPRVNSADIPEDHIDNCYGHNNVQRWASDTAQLNLATYIVKYAHTLLVLPRTEGEKIERPDNPTNNRFNLRLRAHSTTTRIPGRNTGQGGRHRSRTVTAIHEVDSFVRKLPKGHKASPEARRNAAREDIILAPAGQTFVEGHTRGTEETEQGRRGRKIIQIN